MEAAGNENLPQEERRAGVPNKEWDACVQQAVTTVGTGVLVGTFVSALVGATLPVLWGTGISVAWSLKNCRALFRDGIITPEMINARKEQEKKDKEERKREQMLKKEKQKQMKLEKQDKKRKTAGEEQGGDKTCCIKLKEWEKQRNKIVESDASADGPEQKSKVGGADTTQEPKAGGTSKESESYDSADYGRFMGEGTPDDPYVCIPAGRARDRLNDSQFVGKMSQKFRISSFGQFFNQATPEFSGPEPGKTEFEMGENIKHNSSETTIVESSSTSGNAFESKRHNMRPSGKSGIQTEINSGGSDFEEVRPGNHLTPGQNLREHTSNLLETTKNSDRCENPDELVVESTKAETWLFPFNLPAADDFQKKSEVKFKWPPLASSVIVTTRSEQKCTPDKSQDSEAPCTCGDQEDEKCPYAREKIF